MKHLMFMFAAVASAACAEDTEYGRSTPLETPTAEFTIQAPEVDTNRPEAASPVEDEDTGI